MRFMTSLLANITSHTITNHAGEFSTTLAPIFMSRWGGSGDYVPKEFKLTVTAATGKDDAIILKVIAFNNAGNPVENAYLYPNPVKRANWDGEDVNFPLAECPEDVLEAVSTLPDVDLVSFVQRLKAASAPLKV